MVCVLVSTYNGEKYLEEQLNSLIKQEGVALTILVRDDGSKDGTCEILNRWQERGLLTWYTSKNLGFAKSFMDLLKSAPKADYYAFCDQDDIWLPNKLAVAVKRLSEKEEKAGLYCSNLTIYRDGVSGRLMHPENPIQTLQSSLVASYSTGCTQVFSHKLREIVLENPPQTLCAHDLWLFHSAMLFGGVCYDKQAHILYRQHGGNQIGSKDSFMGRWRKRAKSIKTLFAQHYREWEARELIRCYGDLLDKEQLKTLRVVSKFRKNIFLRFKLLFSSKFVAQRQGATFWLKLRIIIGSV